MKVIIFDEQNDCEINCTLETLPDDLPDHSSMSIETSKGVWLNLYWSEWLTYITSTEPISRKFLHNESRKQYENP